MNPEELALRRRFTDLAKRAFARGVYTFTGFLTLSEQSILLSMRRELSHAPFSLGGGVDGAERRMARFGSPALCGYEQAFPIVCLYVAPKNDKFADALTHRDYLGALMHLGVKRDTLGDVMLSGHAAYLFCTETVAPFLIEELATVRHTPVRCVVAENMPTAAAPKLAPELVLVSSPRLDGLIARAYDLSREESAALFQQGRVFLDGAACSSGSSVPPIGSIVSVRGYGRFCMQGLQSESKKGKQRILIEKYES